MKFRPELFFKEAALFAAAMAVGIFTAYRYSLMPDVIQLPEVRFSFWDAFILLGIILFFIFAPKYKKVTKFTFKFFLIFIVFAGTQIVAASVIIPPFDLFIALAAALIFIFLRNVLIHNIGVIFGIAGIASVLGLAISPKTGLFLLVGLSFYDILAVYVTKHMVTMARNMMESGAPFGFIIPSKDQQPMILGSGDVGLPLIFACSLVGLYLDDAIIVALFSLAGLLLTHLIFVNQKVRKPMAALPPVATMAIIGYLVSLWLK